MARSVFCATPPGQTQDSIRVFRAIIKGCIPVTFYRGNDRPFERHLHVRPSALLSLPLIPVHTQCTILVRPREHGYSFWHSISWRSAVRLCHALQPLLQDACLIALTCPISGTLHVGCQSPAPC